MVEKCDLEENFRVAGIANGMPSFFETSPSNSIRAPSYTLASSLWFNLTYLYFPLHSLSPFLWFARRWPPSFLFLFFLQHVTYFRCILSKSLSLSSFLSSISENWFRKERALKFPRFFFPPSFRSVSPEMRDKLHFRALCFFFRLYLHIHSYNFDPVSFPRERSVSPDEAFLGQTGLITLGRRHPGRKILSWILTYLQCVKFYELF